MKVKIIIILAALITLSCSNKMPSKEKSKESPILVKCIISQFADENFTGKDNIGEWYIIVIRQDKTFEVSCSRFFPMTPGVNELLRKKTYLDEEQWVKFSQLYNDLQKDPSYIGELNTKDAWRVFLMTKDRKYSFYQYEDEKSNHHRLFDYILEISPIIIYMHGFA